MFILCLNIDILYMSMSCVDTWMKELKSSFPIIFCHLQSIFHTFFVFWQTIIDQNSLYIKKNVYLSAVF